MEYSSNKELKDKQILILNCIENFTKENGYPPTIRELCNLSGIKSTSTVHDNIKKLTKEGYIVNDPTKPRTIMLTNKYSKPKDNNLDNILKYFESKRKIIQNYISTTEDPILKETLHEIYNLVDEVVIKISTNIL
ncbi:MAG: winged helix-turn-helix transcriptional regulator [Peptostreptococcaceae bacterium]|nr:winged helix-turn-helix transcriptional regulator [Peptostreptococcaceae bacterium]